MTDEGDPPVRPAPIDRLAQQAASARTAASGLDARLRPVLQVGRAWWARIRARLVVGGRAVALLLAVLLVVAIQAAERAWRACRRLAREHVRPGLAAAARAVSRWARTAWARAIPHARKAAGQVASACSRAAPHARRAARSAGAATIRGARSFPGATVTAAQGLAEGSAALARGLGRLLGTAITHGAPLSGGLRLVRLAAVVLHDAEYRRIVPLAAVPEHVREAVITAEDRRFHDHDGYDPVAIGRAVEANIEANGIVQGGSTITQQLAKQNFVGDAQSLDRKLAEVVHAVALEKRYSKAELLQRYLNEVYFGSGAYGIAAAAEEFFRAEPSELSVAQAALLAGQIRAPGAFSPREDPEAAAERRDQVIEQMVAESHLDPDEAEAARSEPVEVAPPLDDSPSEPYVVEAVKREFLATPAFGETREERLETLLTGGLHIETTLDPGLHDLARDVVRQHLDALGGPSAALAAVQPGTGRLLAFAAGGDFDERQFDLAMQGRRQPGSAFKTFAAIAALEEGVDPDDPLPGSSPDEHDLPDGQVWEVQNFGDADVGPVDLPQALVQSVNTAFAELTMQVGHERVVDVATRLGIGEGAFGEASTHGPSIALGGLTHGVSPVEMSAAYAAVASGGRYAEPFLIERAVNRHGEVVYERDVEPVQAIDEDVAAATLDMLTEVVAQGTGVAAQIPGWPAAGKTGTTQNSADAWFAGAVPSLATAVWVGHPDEQTPVPGLTGGSAAAPLWQDFVSQAVADLEPEDFDG